MIFSPSLIVLIKTGDGSPHEKQQKIMMFGAKVKFVFCYCMVAFFHF